MKADFVIKHILLRASHLLSRHYIECDWKIGQCCVCLSGWGHWTSERQAGDPTGEFGTRSAQQRVLWICAITDLAIWYTTFISLSKHILIIVYDCIWRSSNLPLRRPSYIIQHRELSRSNLLQLGNQMLTSPLDILLYSFSGRRTCMLELRHLQLFMCLW